MTMTPPEEIVGAVHTGAVHTGAVHTGAVHTGAADTCEPLTPALLIERASSLTDTLAKSSSAQDQTGGPVYAAFGLIRHARLGAIRVPARLGGAAGTTEDLARIVIALAEGDSSVAQAMLPHFVFVERAMLMATPAQVDNFLARIAQGTLVGGASAERTGKYRGEVRTRIVRDGEHYRLDGVKQYCTGAILGDLVKVMAVDEDGKNVLAVIPGTRSGVTLHDDWDGMGQRGTGSGTSEFSAVQVEAHEIIRVDRWHTERHHTGASSQIIHSAIEVGIARAALRDAVDWGRRGIRPVKESGVARAQDDPYVLHTVGNIAARTHAAQSVVLHAARQIDLAANARLHAPAADADTETIERLAALASIATAQAKIVSTEAALQATQWLFDVGGAATTLRTHNYDRHWRNARTHTTHDPVAYKLKAVGNFYLNDVAPPISYGY